MQVCVLYNVLVSTQFPGTEISVVSVHAGGDGSRDGETVHAMPLWHVMVCLVWHFMRCPFDDPGFACLQFATMVDTISHHDLPDHIADLL